MREEEEEDMTAVAFFLQVQSGESESGKLCVHDYPVMLAMTIMLTRYKPINY